MGEQISCIVGYNVGSGSFQSSPDGSNTRPSLRATDPHHSTNGHQSKLSIIFILVILQKDTTFFPYQLLLGVLAFIYSFNI